MLRPIAGPLLAASHSSRSDRLPLSQEEFAVSDPRRSQGVSSARRERAIARVPQTLKFFTK
jgi:hypothetical protein